MASRPIFAQAKNRGANCRIWEVKPSSNGREILGVVPKARHAPPAYQFPGPPTPCTT